DFMRPFDAVIILEGVNDLMWEITPQRVRDALWAMTQTARAHGVRVIIGRFDSFAANKYSGYWTGLNETATLRTLIDLLAIDELLPRIAFSGIFMSDDGVHPMQLGYDRMAVLAAEKVRDEFPQNPVQ